MSYLVLARKYRPQRFSEVVGQLHVVKTLTNALKSNKVSHALLFSGIKGTGKTTVARIVAKALNCQNLQDGYEPCNECPNCLEINKGSHVDVLEIDAASNRGIDQIRDLIENLKYAPVKGKTKVYIIDEAHMLTKEAANALLKSLEEPPRHVHFILATTEPNKLPPTILSRCQRFDFRRLESKRVVQYLKRICEGESYNMELSALEFIVKEAQGSMRDALSLLDQAMAYGVKTREDIVTALGWHEEALVEDLAFILLEKDLPQAMKLSRELYDRGIDLIHLMEKLTDFFRNLFMAKTLPGETSLEIHNPKLKETFVLSTSEDLLIIFQLLLRDLETLKRTSYPQLQFELTLAKICEYKKLMPLRDILQKLEDLSNKTDPILLPKEEKRTTLKSWTDFLENLRFEAPSLYPILKGLPEPEITEVEIVFKLQGGDSLLKDTYLPRIKEKIEQYFQRKIRVDVEPIKELSLEEIKSRPEVQMIAKELSAKVAHIELLKE
ncbi:MAG: DNA polymerase III subunit gamma/tau [Caldimicrobium sp.]|nr:DNA polymerase III subunit gamma/tau [Caldimicrobium sp.]MCX7613515.1 DNA polymerase III subunit gamma/tau [Caldimicrobium sp.]MDW8182561.1 DNA polymerase III subunit gamma/tau [Caldimicrobium sp.]